ncbi:MAG: C40 family peptidase [Thermoleophilia bacterium]|nr:C40 family peptidase [Thermoleophilia bacterium]
MHWSRALLGAPRLLPRVPRPALVGIALLAVTVTCCAVFPLICAPPARAVPLDLRSVQLPDNLALEVNDLSVQANQIQGEIDALDEELERWTENFNQLQVKLDEVNVQMASLRREYQAAQTEHDYRVKKFEERLCEIYKSGGKSDQFLALLLDSDGLDDLFKRVRLVASLADQDQRIVDSLSESTEKLDTLVAQIEEAKREQLSINQEIDGQRDQIASSLAERERTLAGLDGEIRSIIEAEHQRQEQERAELTKSLKATLYGRSYSGLLPKTDDEVVAQLLETAAFYLGIPYVWAGDRPSTGFDCSGLTQYVYAQHGVYLPHYSGYQAQMGRAVMPEDLKPGDLLCFGDPVHHVGIYIGEGMFIHAPRTGDVVSIWMVDWKTNLSHIRRFDLQPRYGPPTVN